MIRFKASDNVKLVIVAAVMLTSLSLWSCKLISEGTFRMLEAVISLILIVVVLFNSGVFVRKGLHFKVGVLLFLFLPITSVIGAYLFHHQPIAKTLLLERVNIFWLFYFLLHVFNLPIEKLKKVVFFIGGVWAFLTIVQQVTYPNAYFYSRGEDIRAGVIRLMVSGLLFGVFLLFYQFNDYLLTKDRKYLPYVFFIVIALYFHGTRQSLGAALLCMLIAVMKSKGASKWSYLFLVFVVGAILVVVVQPTFITNYVEMTSTQMSDEDYIRFQSAKFFFNDYWPHWAAKLIGNGKPHLDTDYGLEMEYLARGLGLFRQDIGIIGAYNTFGLFYIINTVFVTVKGLFLKIQAEKDKALKYLLLFPAILLPLSFPFSSDAGMTYFSLLFYLMDKAMEKNGDEKLNVNNSFLKKRLVGAI